MATLHIAKLNYIYIFFPKKFKGKGKTIQEGGLVTIRTRVKTKVATATFRKIEQVYNQNNTHINP